MGSCSWGFEDNITNLWGFPDSSAGKESSCNTGDPGLIPGSGRFPGEGHGNPLQGSCLENPHGQRCLAGYSPCRHKESDTIEWPSTVHQFMSNISIYFTFCMHVHACVWLCNLMDYNLPGFSVHAIFWARILEWVANFSSRESSHLRDHICISCLAGGFFTTEPPS